MKGRVKRKQKTANESQAKSKRSSLLHKLLAGFSVSIILMIILGVISYTEASKIITANYKNANVETIKSVSMYFDLMMDTVSAKMQELANDGQMVAYYTKGKEMDSKEFGALYKDIKSSLLSAKTSTDGIGAIYVIGQGKSAKSDKNSSNSAVSGKTNTTYDLYSVTPHATTGELPKKVYKEFLETEEAVKWQDTSHKENWYGYHTFLDEQSGMVADTYAITLVRGLSKGDGYIIADLKKESVITVLDGIATEEGCEVVFVTVDGREIKGSGSHYSDTAICAQLPCYSEAVASKDESGFYETTFGGERYLFTYSKIGETGAMVYTLLPEAAISRQVSGIGTITAIIVVLACIIALGTGLVLALGINKNITAFIKNLGKASKGDMTVHFTTKRKDEFGLLALSMNEMLGSIRELISKVTDVGTQVRGTADNVSGNAELLLGVSGDISTAIGEISRGNSQQAVDTNHCAELMGMLSEQIEKVSMQSERMSTTAMNTRETVDKGMQIMDDLTVKAQETTEITKVVITGIEELYEKSATIHGIIGAIEEIAEQTNLLSLNASIEAARAGEAGKGFAVVADEIRKLADQSMRAVDEIRVIIQDIQNQTESTTKSAKDAEQIVRFQGEALLNTVEAFKNINSQVLSLTENLDEIADNMHAMEQAKIDAVDVIQNISAVSEETAATSQQMEATIESQNNSVKELASKAETLAEDAKVLEETIGFFTV